MTHGPPGVLNLLTGVLRSRGDAVALRRCVARSRWPNRSAWRAHEHRHAIPCRRSCRAQQDRGQIGVAGGRSRPRRRRRSGRAARDGGAAQPPVRQRTQASRARKAASIRKSMRSSRGTAPASKPSRRRPADAARRQLAPRGRSLPRHGPTLDLANAEAWRCLGDAHAGAGQPQGRDRTRSARRSSTIRTIARSTLRSNARSAASSPISSLGIGADHPSLLGAERRVPCRGLQCSGGLATAAATRRQSATTRRCCHRVTPPAQSTAAASLPRSPSRSR